MTGLCLPQIGRSPFLQPMWGLGFPSSTGWAFPVLQKESMLVSREANLIVENQESR